MRYERVRQFLEYRGPHKLLLIGILVTLTVAAPLLAYKYTEATVTRMLELKKDWTAQAPARAQPLARIQTQKREVRPRAQSWAHKHNTGIEGLPLRDVIPEARPAERINPAQGIFRIPLQGEISETVPLELELYDGADDQSVTVTIDECGNTTTL